MLFPVTDIISAEGIPWPDSDNGSCFPASRPQPNHIFVPILSTVAERSMSRSAVDLNEPQDVTCERRA